MSNKEHSDREFYHPEEQEMAETNGSRCGWHFDKVEASRDTGYEKVRNKKCHIIKLLTLTVRSLQ